MKEMDTKKTSYKKKMSDTSEEMAPLIVIDKLYPEDKKKKKEKKSNNFLYDRLNWTF